MMRLCRTTGEPLDANHREWDAIWSGGCTSGIVIEDIAPDRQRCGRAIIVMTAITDAFLAELVTAREPYVLSRLAATSGALTSASEVGAHNAGAGLNYLICYMGWEGEEYHVEPAPYLRAVLVNAFADRHRGNRLKWMGGEVGGPALLDLIHRSGGRILNDYEEWAREHEELDGAKRPYLIGGGRDDVFKTENQWLTGMFTYFPPVFHFTELQRQILLLAREGMTDAEIGDQIGVSADAVKKRWGGIYDRVAEVFPDLLPESPLGGRGAEKRRTLLAHLRERPEELRAYSPASPASR